MPKSRTTGGFRPQVEVLGEGTRITIQLDPRDTTLLNKIIAYYNVPPSKLTPTQYAYQALMHALNSDQARTYIDNSKSNKSKSQPHRAQVHHEEPTPVA